MGLLLSLIPRLLPLLLLLLLLRLCERRLRGVLGPLAPPLAGDDVEAHARSHLAHRSIKQAGRGSSSIITMGLSR